jgi:hypothetical protein
MLAFLLAFALTTSYQEAKPADGSKYYFAIFSWESTPYDPTKTHTFATAIQLKDGKTDLATLSWFPATEVVRPVQILPEKGTNMDLEKSLDFAKKNDLRVSVWGPFEVSEKFFVAFQKHIVKFDKGEVGYRPCSAIAVNKDTVFDCAHALENFYRKEQSIIGPLAFGDQISGRIANELSGEYLGDKLAHPEVLAKLGLEKYPLTKRELDKPTLGASEIKKP